MKKQTRQCQKGERVVNYAKVVSAKGKFSNWNNSVRLQDYGFGEPLIKISVIITISAVKLGSILA